jgi:simple sugar transport system permease protein
MRLALPALGITLNSELLVSAPYLLALIAMLLLPTANREPLALGQPFERGAG